MKNISIALFLIALVFLPLGAQAADQDSYQLARRLVDLQVGEEARKKAADTLILMITPLVMRDNPGKQDAVTRILQESFAPIIASAVDDSSRQTAELYAQTFSPEELQSLIDFQNSDLGKKFRRFNIESLPKVKDFTKAAMLSKTTEATKALVTQLKANDLNVPKELDH